MGMVQEHLKYHIVAVLGLQIILALGVPSSINDVTMLPTILGEMRRQHLLPDPSIFHADRGYDSNYNRHILFTMGIMPNITQRSKLTVWPLPPNLVALCHLVGGFQTTYYVTIRTYVVHDTCLTTGCEYRMTLGVRG